MKIIKGTTIEEKLRAADIALQRLSRKVKKSYVILMPPVPITLQFEDFKKGASFVFPVKGTIKGGMLRFISPVPKEGVDMTAAASVGTETFSQSMRVTKSVTRIMTEFAVNEGDFVTISGTPVIDEGKEPLRGVASLLWQCDAYACKTLLVEESEDAEETGEETETRSSGQGLERREG